jgi:protein arginine kinase activator
VKTIKVVRMIGGKRQEIEIPAGRARELGISGTPPFPLSVAYLMDGLFVGTEEEDGGAVCDHCGTTMREVLLRRRVGCPRCYDVFSPSIDRLLQFHHRADRHSGRLPSRLQRYRNLFMEREELLQRLSLAVESENFETAAQLRDRINSLDPE